MVPALVMTPSTYYGRKTRIIFTLKYDLQRVLQVMLNNRITSFKGTDGLRRA